jgi:DNA helicase II / ATP-dependent DNA helicase PcrA
MEYNELNNAKEQELSLEFQKEIERTREEDKLSQTIKLINDEILKYINKRKDLSDYILDYRKTVIEEYRDDEDKIIEYFDHEKFAKEEVFKTIDRRLKELVILLSSPYFGRVDFTESGYEEGETLYIGRYGMTPEGAYEPVVVDWRAPVSALFYTGKLGRASYRAPMGTIEADVLAKRQYIIKKGKLIGLFDSAVDVKDDILQMVLSSNTSQKLKDIIMTIQEEQDNLIRQPREKTIVVNGVAGSGKTTIALHRVAYLLYNYRESLQDKVLILGPNNIFMEYISTVLPSLGEVGVKQKTFNDFAMDILDLEDIMNFKDYIGRIFSGDRSLINEVLYKSSEDYTEVLDKELEVLDKEYFHMQDVSYFDKVIVPLTEIKELFYNHYVDMPLFRRSKKVRRIIFSKLKDARDEVVREIEREHRELLASLSKDELERDHNDLEFRRKLKIREAIREVLNTKEALRWLDNPSLIDIYNKLNKDKELIQDDLAPMLYLKLKLEGVRLGEEIKHVVIDEAQDYSSLQFKVLKELTKCISMTVVGDANQRLLPLKGEVPMLKLHSILKDLDIEHFALNKSYRSTMEIMKYAGQFLVEEGIIPLVRSGEPVEEKSFNSSEELMSEIKSVISDLSKQGYESTAVICRDLEELKSLAPMLKDEAYIKVIDQEDMIYTGGTVLIPSYFAKGLEFDAVIVVSSQNPNKLAGLNTSTTISTVSAVTTIDEISEERIKYVMHTRALHKLYDFKV